MVALSIPTTLKKFSISDKISKEKKVEDDATPLLQQIPPSQTKNATKPEKRTEALSYPWCFFSGYECKEELDFSDQHLSPSEISSKLARCRIVKKLDLSGCCLTKVPDFDNLVEP